uniref:CUB domain-containing protein n=1 Tax=Anabas testudineus TaxID=64144 RepID=A0A3Q1JHX3_ANATE
ANCAYDYIKIYNAASGFLLSSLDMCGGVLTGLSGVITSPGYPQEYSNNADCSWAIHVSNTSVVTLVFLDFQLENNEGCNFDFVAMFDGPTVTHRHLGKYCGADKPPYTVTTSNQLLVVFKSDFNIGGRGFKTHSMIQRILSSDEMKIEHFCSHGTKSRLTYQINCTLTGECQQVLSAVSGNFSSPHFPNIYPNNINCHWSIALAAGYRIKLFFPVMDLEDRNSLSDECDYDSIAVYDGDSQTDTLLGRWCGREQPSSLISKGNKLLVVLSTDRNKAHRGFTASYVGGKCCFCRIKLLY